MAGDFRKINSMIWSDSSWRALPPLEQWLYFALLTNSKTSYVGVLDWRPRKLAGLADGVSGADLKELAQELQRKRFILIDEEREECLVRSFIKHDGVLKNQNLGKSIGRDFAATYSEPIRQVIVHEVQKLVDSAEDDLKAVTNKYSRPFILEILRNPSAPIDQFLDPQSSSVIPQPTPGQGPEGTPTVAPERTPEPTPGVGGQPTGGHPPSPSPSPPSKEGGLGETSRRKPEVSLPVHFTPTPSHEAKAKELGVNLQWEFDKFVNHHQARDSRFRNWDQALHGWLKRAAEFNSGRPGPPQPQSSFDPWSGDWNEEDFRKQE